MIVTVRPSVDRRSLAPESATGERIAVAHLREGRAGEAVAMHAAHGATAASMSRGHVGFRSGPFVRSAAALGVRASVNPAARHGANSPDVGGAKRGPGGDRTHARRIMSPLL